MSTDLNAWLETRLGHLPRDAGLFARALTHGSLGEPDYERLEFLGDRVLGLAIADWLYQIFPNESEGKLAHRLNGLVSGEICAEIGRELGLPAYMRLGRQASDDGVFESDNVLGDVVEALIGALWLDGGADAANAFVRRYWQERIGEQRTPPKHPKALLQEWAAAHNRKPPLYDTLSRSGPDHRPQFLVRVTVNGAGSGEGSGPSRQDAETAAARDLLGRL